MRTSTATETRPFHPRRPTSRYRPANRPSRAASPASRRTVSSLTVANAGPEPPCPASVSARNAPAVSPARSSIRPPTCSRNSRVRPRAVRGRERSSNSRTPGRNA
ncbi:hypothetical protein KEF29_24845 [Streptomyces tuirus]|uniref:Uncharacterized protein n=1 Tax=Streptomyces tuirus TaxID=68278 RepID=A0A941J0F3_9ACTN|nr:hypothetical protein [Streptomyces tuirus]